MFVEYLDKIFYPSVNDNWDNKLFREEILQYLNDKTILLDIGAGAGIVEEMHFKDKVKEVYGVDPDPRVAKNPNVSKGYVGLGNDMPFFEDGKFDVVICDNVLEHIKDGKSFFSEVKRVLKEDGVFLVKTPNKYHYMPLIASLTPNWFHKLYNKIRGRDEDDTFPTLYKVNSTKAFQEIAEKCDLKVEKIEFFEKRPEYLRISFITYIPGIIYERFVNLFNIDFLKILLVGVFRKTAEKPSETTKN